MTTKLKYRLPLYSELSWANMSPTDLEEWKAVVVQHGVDFDTALSVNSQLCRFHPTLTTSTYGDLLQINLTDSVYNNDDITPEDFNSTTPLGTFKQKMALARNGDSVFSEHSFTQPTEVYKKWESLISRTLSKFQSQPTRLRLVKLPPGKHITPHIDYDPSYAVRIIYPIVSPADCINIFWTKNGTETVNFKEGAAYFLNTGYRHAVVNLGAESRYTLMITLNGSSDLDRILLG